ncbi:MAG: hypothetical protein FWD90_02875 [Defluviitaleaceae bacterium]|nr:hypothetical protein [Defluviitaleaceae bacterium]
MFCVNCGTKFITDDALFCTNCGDKKPHGNGAAQQTIPGMQLKVKGIPPKLIVVICMCVVTIIISFIGILEFRESIDGIYGMRADRNFLIAQRIQPNFGNELDRVTHTMNNLMYLSYVILFTSIAIIILCFIKMIKIASFVLGIAAGVALIIPFFLIMNTMTDSEAILFSIASAVPFIISLIVIRTDNILRSM